MTKLKELMNSFATVIVRYHDSQPNVPKVINETDLIKARQKSQEHAALILKSSNSSVGSLDALITKCTQTYSGRFNFLNFLISEISFLQALLERTTSLNEQEFQELEQQLIQLFVDFKTLLNTKKYISYDLRVSELTVANKNRANFSVPVKGLLNDAYIGSKYCNSGILLIEEVLEPLTIDANSSETKIKNIANWLCTEFQNHFLTAELKDLKLSCDQQKSKITELEGKLRSTSTKVSESSRFFSSKIRSNSTPTNQNAGLAQLLTDSTELS
ncbi:MAG: hypothetical protein WC627_13365 [Legionella sp.]